MKPPPLNGTKTHSLSNAAFEAMDRMPCPRQEINAGVINRLAREALIEDYEAASPYRTHKPGTKVVFVRLTEAGEARRAGRIA